MELYTLNINVNKQRLSFGENKPEIFSGDQSIDFVEFTFEDDMWNFPDIWAIFSRFKGTSYQVALEDNKVMIPAEVMQNRGYVYIGLMATDGENVQTSNVLQYSIGQGSTNVDAITPSASIYEQFLADLDAYQTAVADLDDIESRITTAEGNVSRIEQAVTDLNEQLGDIDADISTINGQITTIQNNIGTAQGDIVSIQNGINALNGQVAGLDTAVGTLSNRVTALQSSVTSLEGRLTTVGNTLTDFEGRLTTAGTTLTNLEGSISDAENDIQTVQGDIETIQSDIEDIQTAIEQNNVVTDVTAEGISLVDNHIADLSFMCVTDTASGDVASFPDGSGVAMKKAEVSLEPVQDLHGYDKPWAGGGGKNLFDYNNAVTRGLSRDNGVFTNTLTDTNTRFVFMVQQFNGSSWGQNVGTTVSAAGRSFLNITINSQDVTKIRIKHNGSAVDLVIEYPFTKQGNFTISVDVVSANPSVVGGLVFKNVQIEEGTTMTDYAPYENICLIDGYEDVGVSVVGKNLFDKTSVFEVNGHFGTTIMPSASHKTIYIPCKPNTTYTVSNTANSRRTLGYTTVLPDVGVGVYGVATGTITTGSDAKYLVCYCYNQNTDSVTYQDVLNALQLELGSTATAYEPYAGTDYTTDLGRTVYGGTVDLATGELVVDRVLWTNNTANMNNGEAYPGWKNAGIRNIVGAGLNAFYTTKANFGERFAVNTTGANDILWLPVTGYYELTETQWKALALDVQIIIPLETPQTYQLTPQQIQTLVGANNVWSEDGAIEVEYIANLKDYIDKKINA